ncbi:MULTISPECIES: thiolase family protein [Desulfococcus]|jgi:acetyl-CoA C-acetyltransferase|uniref:Acetyl-CoA acetyltransferase n=1 Tax=Desulfococcus multivorans DSM 2059 TaxID=1121405 RepID=S7TXR2_DESML|nr:acetyl-CoA C-acyltransferase [Desulfococcus multivorans]AOY56861.1 AtoB1: acetyl-CoA acetyltransferase (acetoacetyl-CoA thiolase) [Desulfococcus multivorans]AQU99402.1 acetyl-CoA acetyltransferase [Desulfococcus multivorans]EPR41876.1 acetyl-CoA acetyltransferase [Desulfococcus multivorans DSM 2059]MDX9817313.1 acetyl-CoA C-acyltransferase [Desulfococcus multivorans]SJZ93627.1 acetyl-CoA acetyltransferase [Desulfococcus multivorans DSM 2059]
MKDVVIVSACRTAIGAFGGSLKDMNGAAIACVTMKSAIERAGIDPAIIDDVRYGCCLEHHDTLNVTRVAALMAGIPESVPAVTINRVCISGMEAVLSGMAMIQAGMADVILAGGVEHMSGVPYAVPNARWGCRLQDHTFVDALIHALHCGSHLIPLSAEGPVDTEAAPAGMFLGKPYIMGHTAEFVAQHLGISREEMDEVALRSHNNAERATRDGAFREEIVPVEVPQRKKASLLFDKDEHFRPGITMAQLRKLPPAFVPEIGKVTAGNASGINDGSSAMIIMSAEKAGELNLTPIARIKAVGKGACHPSVMGLSPVPAVKDLFNRSGLGIGDFELVEVNEAFASQYIGCERELGLNREITNVNGSGIGLGHPVGSTGSRIMVTLIHAMKQRGKTLGLATLCGGGGVSMACALEML